MPKGFADHLADRQSAQFGFPFYGPLVESDAVGSVIDLVISPLCQGRAVVEAEQLDRIVETDLGKGCWINPVLDQKNQVVQPVGVLFRQRGQGFF